MIEKRNRFANESSFFRVRASTVRQALLFKDSIDRAARFRLPSFCIN
jgi:hypothetical protein